jgi:tape measure domain-containing protein
MANLDYSVAIKIALGGDDGVRALRDHFVSLGKSAEQADALAKGLAGEIQQARAVIQSAGNPTAQLTAYLKSLGGSEKDAAELARRLTAELRNYEKAAQQAEAQSKKLGVSLDDIKRLAGQAAGALGVGFTAREFVQAAADVEKLKAGLTAVTGDAAKARAEFEFVRSVAQRVGVDIVAAGEAFLGLAAATKGTAVEGEPTRQVFEAVSNAMSKAGKSSAETRGALNALAQIASKGTVAMEELRQQLGERLPGALPALAKELGITTADLIKLVEQGRLAASDVFPALAAGLNELYGTAPQAQTLAQEITGIRNAFVDVSTAIAESGGLAALKTGAEVAQTAIVLLGDALVTVGKTIGVLAGAVASLDFSGVTEAFAEIERESQTRLLNAAKNNEVLAGYIRAVGSESTKAALAAQEQAAAQQAQAAAAANAAKATEGQAKSLIGLTAQYPLLAQAIGGVQPAAESAGKAVGGVGQAIDKLPVEKLSALAAQANEAFGKGAITAEQYATAMDRVAEGAAKAIGVNLPSYAQEVSAQFAAGLEALTLFVGRLDGLKASGVDTGAALVAAFDAMSKKAGNTAEIDALTERVRALGEAGVLSASQIDSALTALQNRAAELTPGIQTLAEAYRTLGVTSQAELRKAADSAKEAFDVLRRGQAPLADLRAAFGKYADAQIRAHGESAKTALEAQAAVLGIEPAWIMAKDAAERAGDAGQEAGAKIAAGADAATSSLDRAASAAGRLRAAQAGGRYDAQGFSLNTAGQRVSAQLRSEEQSASQRANIIRDELGALGIDQNSAEAQQYAALRQQITDIEARLDAGNRGVNRGLRSGTPDAGLAAEMQRLREEIGRLQFGFLQAGGGAATGASGTSAASTAPTTRTVTLRLQTGGQTSSINLADDASADELIEALRRAGLVAA